MKSLNEIGREFNEHSGAAAAIDHGIERAYCELDEAAQACIDGTTEQILMEMADVVLTLASTAASCGLDLDAAITRKHAVNMQRNWAPHTTIPGAVKHVKEPSK